MRSWLLVSAVLITISISPCNGQHPGWKSGYEDARTAAEKEGLPVLLHFHAWYCGPCQQMDRNVFPDPEVRHALESGLVSVQIDVSRESELASQYGASTVPRDVVVFDDGSVETLHVGYMSKASYLALLNDIARRGRDKKLATIKPSEAPVPTPVDPVTTPGLTQNSMDSATTAETPFTQSHLASPVEPLIGLEGYCPVRLHQKREWTPGLADITADYRDVRYRFASPADREIFLNNPAEFAPQDLGCDPVLLTRESRAITGSIRFGAFFDRKLYLFKTLDSRDQFKLNPLGYVRVRSALHVRQIEGTRIE